VDPSQLRQTGQCNPRCSGGDGAWAAASTGNPSSAGFMPAPRSNRKTTSSTIRAYPARQEAGGHEAHSSARLAAAMAREVWKRQGPCTAGTSPHHDQPGTKNGRLLQIDGGLRTATRTQTTRTQFILDKHKSNTTRQLLRQSTTDTLANLPPPTSSNDIGWTHHSLFRDDVVRAD